MSLTRAYLYFVPFVVHSVQLCTMTIAGGKTTYNNLSADPPKITGLLLSETFKTHDSTMQKVQILKIY